MKKQRTGPPQSAGIQAEDRTPQSVGNSSRGQDPLSLQGTLSEVRAPSICRGPKQSTGLWVQGLHARSRCSIPPLLLSYCPTAERPQLAYGVAVGTQCLSHALQPSPWRGDSGILETP